MFNNRRKILIFVWLVLYECLNIIGNRFDVLIKALLLMAYDLFTVLYVVKKGYAEKIGLCRIAEVRNILFMLPFLAFPIYNLALSGFKLAAWKTVLLMIPVCFTEELFFRGIIQNIPKSKSCGLWLSAVVFGLAHAVNLPQYDMAFAAVQIISAFSAGLAYGAMTIKSRSLLPAVLLHFITNITAVSDKTDILGLSLCVLCYIIYSIIYLKIFKTEEENAILH